jgi:succinate dehydrogenase/fumarate reductase flavoprotein subunit
MIKPLEAAAKAKGVDIQLKTEMTKLIRESGPSGRVTGIAVKSGNRTLYFRARKAVILASGSWKGHKYLRSLQDPRITDEMSGTGYPFVDDDGIGMLAAIEAGSIMTGDRADDRHVWHRMFGTRYYRFAPGQPFAAPGIGALGQLSGGDMGYVLFINKAGVRFVDEAAGEGTNGFYDYALAQPGHVIWTIFDDAAARKNQWTPTPPTVEPDMAFSALTWTDLAKAISVPADALTDTVTRYNSYVDQKADPDFKKSRIYLANKIETPPFHAVAVSLQVHDTMGGLPVNAKAQVLDIYGKVIPGLYAAGEVAGSLDIIGMPKGVVMGRIAGESAAGEKTR